MTSIKDLLSPRTREEIKGELIEGLREREFPVTAWAEGDVARTLVEIDAEAFSNAEQLIAAIAEGGLGAKASGEWLRVRARNFYALEPREAQFAEGQCVLTAIESAPDTDIQPGSMWLRDAESLRFVNVDGGNLASGGTLTLTFRAESPGSRYNVANNTITKMVTPIPGVTVNNPGSGGQTWLSKLGSDDESDASLYSRIKDRWAQIGSAGATAATYRQWAREASDLVRQVRVDAKPAGIVNIYIAGDSGNLPGEVPAVRAYIRERAPLCVTPLVFTAQSQTVSVTGTIYVTGDPALSTGIEACGAYIRSVEMGGTVRHSQIIAALSQGEGISHVELSYPTADIELWSIDVAIPNLSGVTVVQI